MSERIQHLGQLPGIIARVFCIRFALLALSANSTAFAVDDPAVIEIAAGGVVYAKEDRGGQPIVAVRRIESDRELLKNVKIGDQLLTVRVAGVSYLIVSVEDIIKAAKTAKDGEVTFILQLSDMQTTLTYSGQVIVGGHTNAEAHELAHPPSPSPK